MTADVREREKPPATDEASHDGGSGMTHLGMVPQSQQALLRRVYDAARIVLATAWAESVAKREVFWINLWRRASEEAAVTVDGVDELDRWVRELIQTAYAGEEVQLEGYGFIVNPIDSKAQLWHVDYYTLDYSNLFIPLSKLTTENATQYLVLPPNTPRSTRQALADLPAVDVNELLASMDYVTVRQMLARPYSIMKMDFGAVHRGIANTSGFERVLFWISVTRAGFNVHAEPLIEVFNLDE